MTDGVSGSLAYDDGSWVGMENGKKFSVTVDLGKVQEIHEVTAEFVQNYSAYIFMPASVTVEVSREGSIYTKFGVMEQPSLGRKTQTKTLRLIDDEGMTGRYVRLTVEPGSFAWTFMDEITIKQ